MHAGSAARRTEASAAHAGVSMTLHFRRSRLAMLKFWKKKSADEPAAPPSAPEDAAFVEEARAETQAAQSIASAPPETPAGEETAS